MGARSKTEMPGTPTDRLEFAPKIVSTIGGIVGMTGGIMGILGSRFHSETGPGGTAGV